MDDEKRKAVGAKLDAMFREEIREMERKGATAADLREPVLQDMVRQQVLKRHGKEIFRDPELVTFLVDNFFDNASPTSLRELAATGREDGDLDGAYDIETLADLRERGEQC
jgi:hypothetical protein